MKNILILSAGRRVELVKIFMREINLKNQNLKIFTTDINPNYSAACQFSNRYFKTPKVDEINYIDFLLDKCKKYNIGMIIPTIDNELSILSKNQKLFESHEIFLIISEINFIKTCEDKRLTSVFFEKFNLSSPKIYQKNKIKFPCYVKPYSGSSGIGCYKVEKKEDLPESIKNDDKIILTEFVGKDYCEYTVDMYYNRHGSLKCLVPRQRIEVRAGEISKGITRKNCVYELVLSKFKKLPGAKGCITLQLFYNENIHQFFFIEINPRFGGGFPLSYSANANFPKWLINEYFLNQEVTFFDNWKKDLLMLRYDSKILVK
jgi:carbamoyl-phosphate synthase large subunit